MLAIPARGLEVQGEPGAVVLALLLLARLHVFPVDLALLNGAEFQEAGPHACARPGVAALPDQVLAQVHPLPAHALHAKGR